MTIGVATLSSPVALSAATDTTLVQILAASNRRAKILGYGVSFNGTSETEEPAEVTLERQTGAGTSVDLTPTEYDEDGASLETSALQTFTVEPTDGNVLEMKTVHPQTCYEKYYPPGAEPILPEEGRVGIKVNYPASGDALAFIIFEE